MGGRRPWKTGAPICIKSLSFFFFVALYPSVNCASWQDGTMSPFSGRSKKGFKAVCTKFGCSVKAAVANMLSWQIVCNDRKSIGPVWTLKSPMLPSFVNISCPHSFNIRSIYVIDLTLLHTHAHMRSHTGYCDKKYSTKTCHPSLTYTVNIIIFHKRKIFNSLSWKTSPSFLTELKVIAFNGLQVQINNWPSLLNQDNLQ